MNENARGIVAAVLADPEARTQLARALAAEAGGRAAGSAWSRARPLVAAASSAAVVLLAFLLPSLQDQWDRYELRSAVDRYAGIGERLMQQRQFQAAEQAFERALELGGQQRLELLESQVRARVLRIYDEPQWRGATSDDVTEADFIYLLGAEDEAGRTRQRAETLAAFGAWLAGQDRWEEARLRLEEALRVDPRSVEAHVHLGNVFDDLGRAADAEREYRAALALDPQEPNAHYNLGLLYAEQGRHDDAVREMRAARAAAPADAELASALVERLERAGATAEARAEAQRATRQFPADKALAAAAARLGEGAARGAGAGAGAAPPGR
jgi:tetratricopeptide (TPR) repeat protein